VTAKCAATILWVDGVELPEPIHVNAELKPAETRDLIYLVGIMDFYPVRVPTIFQVGETYTCFQPYFDGVKWTDACGADGSPRTIMEITKVTVTAGTFKTYMWKSGEARAYITVGSHKIVLRQEAPQTWELLSYSHGAGP